MVLYAELFLQADENGSGQPSLILFLDYCAGVFLIQPSRLHIHAVDYNTAKEWCTKASELNIPAAHTCLGNIYLHGWGVDRNVALAREVQSYTLSHCPLYASARVGSLFSVVDVHACLPRDISVWQIGLIGG